MAIFWRLNFPWFVPPDSCYVLPPEEYKSSWNVQSVEDVLHNFVFALKLHIKVAKTNTSDTLAINATRTQLMQDIVLKFDSRARICYAGPGDIRNY